jgi:hypothetical protein
MFKRNKRQWVRAGTAGVACAVMVAVGVAVAAPGGSAKRELHPGIFSAYIDKGPDKGLSIWGALSGKIDSSGQINGVLKGDHPPVPVTGTARGRSVKLVFHLPGGLVLTGVGKGDEKITDFASIPTKGRFTGPHQGDSGVWDQVRCQKYGRPGLPEEENQYKCVTSEGKVFIVKLPPISKS